MASPEGTYAIPLDFGGEAERQARNVAESVFLLLTENSWPDSLGLVVEPNEDGPVMFSNGGLFAPPSCIPILQLTKDNGLNYRLESYLHNPSRVGAAYIMNRTVGVLRGKKIPKLEVSELSRTFTPKPDSTGVWFTRQAGNKELQARTTLKSTANAIDCIRQEEGGRVTWRKT